MVIDGALIDKVIEFIQRGKQWVTPDEVAYDIIDIMQWGEGWSDWPKGTAAEYREAVNIAVSQGKLQQRDGKVWLATEPVIEKKPEVTQLELF